MNFAKWYQTLSGVGQSELEMERTLIFQSEVFSQGRINPQLKQEILRLLNLMIEQGSMPNHPHKARHIQGAVAKLEGINPIIKKPPTLLSFLASAIPIESLHKQLEDLNLSASCPCSLPKHGQTWPGRHKKILSWVQAGEHCVGIYKGKKAPKIVSLTQP